MDCRRICMGVMVEDEIYAEIMVTTPIRLLYDYFWG